MPISWSKEDSKHDGVQIYVSRSLADMLGTNPPPLGMLITYYLKHMCIYKYTFLCDLQHEDWYRIYFFQFPHIGGTLTTILGIVLEISCSNEGTETAKRLSWKTKQNKCISSWWLNHPSEKYESNWKSSPRFGVKIKNMWVATTQIWINTVKGRILGWYLHPDSPMISISKDGNLQRLLQVSIMSLSFDPQLARLRKKYISKSHGAKVSKQKPLGWKLVSNKKTLGIYMDVSENSGTLKSSILIGFSIFKPSILGYPYFWKHPYMGSFSHNFSRRLSRSLPPVNFDPPPAVAANLVGAIRRSSTRVSPLGNHHISHQTGKGTSFSKKVLAGDMLVPGSCKHKCVFLLRIDTQNWRIHVCNNVLFDWISIQQFENYSISSFWWKGPFSTNTIWPRLSYTAALRFVFPPAPVLPKQPPTKRWTPIQWSFHCFQPFNLTNLKFSAGLSRF